MTYQPATVSDDLNSLPKLHAWVTSSRGETLETVAFRSEAALTVLEVLPSCCQQIVLPCERRGSRSHLSGVIGPKAERIVAGVAV